MMYAASTSLFWSASSLFNGLFSILATPSSRAYFSLLHNAALQRAFSAHPRHEIIASLKTVCPVQ